MTPHDFVLFIYNLSLIPIIFFSVLFVILVTLNLLLEKKDNSKFEKLKEHPFITVQIPTYNDPIAKRCIKQCMQFDYPKDKYEIIISDDSTSLTTQKLLKKFAEKVMPYDEGESAVNFILENLDKVEKYISTIKKSI